MLGTPASCCSGPKGQIPGEKNEGEPCTRWKGQLLPAVLPPGVLHRKHDDCLLTLMFLLDFT